MSEYPVILIPSSIENARTVLPPIQTEQEFTGDGPRKPGQTPKKFYGQGTAICSFIAVLIGGFVSSWLSLPLFPCLAFFLTIIIICVNYLFQSYPKRLQKHHQKTNEYNRELIKFKNKKTEYVKYVDKERTPEKVTEFQHKNLLKVLHRTTSHDGNNSDARVGPYEYKLCNALEKYFPAKIKTKLMVQNPEYSLGYHYTPDCSYIDSDLNLYIDIELDEPYTKNGKAIHFIGLSKDIKRDNHFNSRGWIVIRFSEEQVVCWTESCCKTVAQVIADVTTDYSVLAPFQDVPDLKRVKRWTELESIKMAENNYRNNYPCQSSKFKFIQVVTPCEPEIIVYNSPKDIPLNSRKAQRTIRRGFSQWCKEKEVTNKTLETAKLEYLNSITRGKLADWLAVEDNWKKAINKILEGWEIQDNSEDGDIN